MKMLELDIPLKYSVIIVMGCENVEKLTVKEF